MMKTINWLLLGLALLGAGGGQVNAADGVVGNGSPGSCTEGAFTTVLATVQGSGGGTVTFNCGAAPHTIPFTGYKQISTAVVIEGGNLVAFNGQGTAAFFQVFFSGNLTLRNIRLENGAFSASHPLENFGTLTLEGVTVADNSTGGSTLANYGDLTIHYSSLMGNENTAANGDGGAVRCESGTAVITHSSFGHNTTSRNGAAIYSMCNLTITNTTFSQNGAGSGGGAVYQTSAGTAVLNYVTVANNTAGAFGAGIYNDGGGGSNSLTISKSIVAHNSTGNCDGVITSAGYNFTNNTGCGAFTQTGDQQNANLPLGNYAGHGGPTFTMPLLAGNAARDAIPLAQCGLPEDQRGVPRPFGAGCDSGAFEFAPTIYLPFVRK